MLENIKHLFGIPHLVFVVSIDKVQLSKSIQAIYGQIDTENYLRRFFDLEYILSNPSPLLQIFCLDLKKRLNIQTDIAKIFITDNFTLRELQKILPQIKLLEIQQFQGDNKKFEMIHAIFILLIKIYRPDLYLQIPNTTDIEGVMGIAEKLVCKEDKVSGKDVFMKCIGMTYAINTKSYIQDAIFLIHSIKKERRKLVMNLLI